MMAAPALADRTGEATFLRVPRAQAQSGFHAVGDRPDTEELTVLVFEHGNMTRWNIFARP